jgi:hypothetical protein
MQINFGCSYNLHTSIRNIGKQSQVKLTIFFIKLLTNRYLIEFGKISENAVKWHFSASQAEGRGFDPRFPLNKIRDL